MAFPNGPHDPQTGRLRHDTFPQATTTTLLIDSRDRDHAAYPDPGRFVLRLLEPIHNVSSALLVCAEIPSSYYVFSAARGNTSLVVAIGPDTRTVTVPDGSYTTEGLAAALAAALTAAFSAPFVVTFDPTTLRCRIEGPAGLAVDTTATDAARPTAGGLGYHLGFAPGVVTQGVAVSGGSAVEGASLARINPETYLLVRIDDLDVLKMAGSVSGRDAFAKVPMKGGSYSYTFHEPNSRFANLGTQKARLEKLAVSLTFHDGTPVDMNGADWAMTIEFVHTLTR